MGFTLDDFEKQIDKTIVQRGKKYFKEGCVADCTALSDNEYEVIVSGSYNYKVHLTIQSGEVEDYQCNCPYDFGPVCKHTVAALYYLKEGNVEDRATKNKQQKPKKLKVNDVLKALSHEELKTFISDYANSHTNFRNHLLASFSYLNPTHSKELYQQQIRSAIATVRDRYGFISWRDINELIDNFSPLTTSADKFIAEEHYRNAIYIYTALSEELLANYENCDDSSGMIGNEIDISFEKLVEIAKKPLSEEDREMLFDYAITSFKDNIYSGWDWHLSLLKIAEKLISDKAEYNVVLESLDTFNGDYSENKAQEIRLEIIRKHEGDVVANQFLEEKISIPAFREKAIEQALDNKDYTRAIQLTEEGIEQSENNQRIGGVWYNWMLKIYQAKGDKAHIIKYAKHIFIHGVRSEQDSYKVLQDIASSEWNTLLDELILEVKSISAYWVKESLLRYIYIQEQMWNGLFELLEMNPTLEKIEANEEYLSKDYAEDLVLLYFKLLPDFVENNVGRNHYRQACKYLKNMQKLGADNEVKRLVVQFKATYPRRRALLDELRKV